MKIDKNTIWRKGFELILTEMYNSGIAELDGELQYRLKKYKIVIKEVK